MSTETTMPDGPINPFMNAQLEIKLDELLTPAVKKALEDAGSGVKMTISHKTLRLVQTAAWDSSTGAITLGTAEKAALAVVEALGIELREDDPEPEETDGAQ